MNLNQLIFDDFHRRKKISFLNRSFSLLIFFTIVMTAQVFAQSSQTISGTVRDAGGQPIPGVNVKLKSTTLGTSTDPQGRYTLKVTGTSGILEFSYIGFTTIEENINNRTTINVTLNETSNKMDEVVVIGYGTVKRRDLTGSVASVSGKDIAATPVPNIAQAMQGKLPGVKITAQDGRPGADIAIRVRGGGSISQSNQPLVLIDGIPGNLNDIAGDQVESIDVLKDASSTAIYGTRGANGVVLVTTKSAKAGITSVSYNGYARYNTPTKYLESLGPYDYLRYVWANTAANGVAYQTPFEKLYGIGAFPGTNTGGIESYRNLASDDIQKQVYNESLSWSHALTLTGGTDKTKILFSATYTDDQGMKVKSYVQRANAQFKITQKIFDNVTFDLNARYTRTPSLGDEGTSTGMGSLLSSAYRFRPIATANILGDLTALRTGNIESYGKNSLWDQNSPLSRLNDADPYTKNQNVFALTSLNWGIVKGLTYHTDFSLSGSWGLRKFWTGAIVNNYANDATGAKAFSGAADYRKTDGWASRWTNLLKYELDINASNRFDVTAGYEFANSGGTSLSVQASRFPASFTKETAFAQIHQYDKPTNSFGFSSDQSFPNRMISYFGRANYTLFDKYLLTLTFRADGSSRFAPSNRWGYFPGGAVAWRASEESFLKNVKWLDNLKLRASYGEVGNDLNDPGLWNQSWGSVTDERMQYAINHQRQSAYQVNSDLANPNLKWETTVTRNIGLDFGIFKGRLSGTIEGYWNTTKDLLVNTQIPGITSFPTTNTNVGQTSNKGFEFSLFGTIYQSTNWKVSAGGNINFNKNNIDKLTEGMTGLYGANWSGTASYPLGADYILRPGSPVGIVRGLTYAGFYTPADFNFNNGIYTLKPGTPDVGSFVGIVHGITNANRPAGQIAYPGVPKYKDLNSDGKIDEKDISVIGDMNPTHTGGFNFNVAYKNFDLGLNFNWSYGNQIYNATKLSDLNGPKESGVYENKLAILKNGYKIYDVVNGQLVRLTTPEQLNAANANATLPLAYNEGGVTTDFGIEDGSFLRLNTLTLGYRLPKSILSKVKLTNLYLYGSIFNAFTITNYSGLDPEVGANDRANNARYPTTGLDFGAYPRARAFVFGLNLNF